ncbi:unnamed protein product [Caenorhabditis auriculariae]|uniref:Uncharacterized protein n=1 Tax=Caenorhabditis auriculariae TaxID=2777116 RepID=A0A8S1H828_9PELO|nr:unnamed protein product [Caenorhabditis auriculariae]
MPSLNSFLLLLFAVTACSASIFLEQKDGDDKECHILKNEPIHEVMDQICDMCHELSSHSKPNMRADCRSECFSTETFRDCLRIFSPRHHAHHHAARRIRG